jgi:two-component system response regulator PilR (NtrC family)/two-component system response regulator HydG
MFRVLVVDNDPEMLDLLRQHLENEGRLVTAVADGAAAVKALEHDEYDVVLTDLVMDGADGWAVLQETQRRQPSARVVLMTAFASLETAIDAIRQGAYDYLTKPFKLAQVTLTINRALDDRRLREENRVLREQVEQRFSFDNLIGRSKAILAVFDKIRAVTASDATILLLGESGTGKELVARAIHHNSPRRGKPFIPVNCAAIPRDLLESELFGHEKGAFTGAIRKRRGLFVDADGGTLFLDEVGDIPAPLQGKILRALQDRTVRPVGGSDEVRLDVRVVSATHRDLMALISDGRFREDLYYRLAVIPIRLPSLRERPDDILLLAEHFLARAAKSLGKPLTGFDQEATAWLLQHRWPGNVRELENVVERAATLARAGLITRGDLGIEFAPEVAGMGVRPTLTELVERYISRVLEETKGDKVAAARILGISVRTLQRRFQVEPEPSSPSDP